MADMKVKRKIQIAVDVLMACDLLVLMSYSVAGEVLHEILGILMFCLFIAHHILSRNFTKALFKGKATPEKIIKIVFDILLTLDMLIMIFSALLVSRHVFLFLNIDTMSSLGRVLHMLGAYWGFALIGIHIGFHLDFMLGKTLKNKKKRPFAIGVMTLLFAAGLIVFVHEGIIKYMFLINQFVFFDTNGGLPVFIIKYILILLMYVALGYALISISKIKIKKRR